MLFIFNILADLLVFAVCPTVNNTMHEAPHPGSRDLDTSAGLAQAVGLSWWVSRRCCWRIWSGGRRWGDESYAYGLGVLGMDASAVRRQRRREQGWVHSQACGRAAHSKLVSLKPPLAKPTSNHRLQQKPLASIPFQQPALSWFPFQTNLTSAVMSACSYLLSSHL